MEASKLLSAFRQALIGHSISFIRLAANSLILYVDGQPGDERGFTIWFEPTWHLSSSRGVLLGSRQAQGTGQQGAGEQELNQVGAPLRVLAGQTISAIDVELRTNDLTPAIGSEHLVRTFVADATDDHSWHIRNLENSMSVYGSPCGLEVRESKRRIPRVQGGA